MHRSVLLVGCAALVGCDSSGRLEGPSSSSGATLGIAGRSWVPTAEMRAEIGTQHFEGTAGADGRYALMIDTSLLDAENRMRPVVLFARVGLVEFASILSDVGTILTRAGADAILDETEDGRTKVNELSTMRYAAIHAVSGGETPSDRAQLDEAEHHFGEKLSATSMLYGAALLRRIAEGSSSLPEPFTTTLGLVLDPASLEGALSPLLGVSAVDASVTAIAKDPALFDDFSATRLSVHFPDLVVEHGGWVWGGSDVLRFDGGGVGFYGTAGAQWPLAASAFAWTIDAGHLWVAYDPPRDSSCLMTRAQIMSVISDSALRARVPDDYDSEYVGCEELAVDFARLGGGKDVDLIVATKKVRYHLDSLLGDGVPATVGTWIDASTWHQREEMPLIPFTISDLEREWVMPVVGPLDRDVLSAAGTTGQPVFSHAIVTFRSDGAVEARGGVFGSSEQKRIGQWSMPEDGTLLIAYDDGGRQTASIMGRGGRGREWGVLSEYRSPDGEPYAMFDRARPLDGSLLLTETDLMTDADRYWQTSMCAWVSMRDGTLDRKDVFGWRFDNHRVARQIAFEEPDAFRTAEWSFDVSPAGVTLELRKDWNGRGACEPQSDPSCFVNRRRTWTPIAKEGDSLWVFESDSIPSEDFLRRLGWDEEKLAWVDESGHPLDPEANRQHMFLPRLNMYWLESMPSP